LLVGLKAENGCTGWGDAAPLPGFSVETADEVESELGTILKQLPGTEIRSDANPSRTASWSGSGNFSPSAVCGFETALTAVAATSDREAPETDLSGFPAPVPVNGLLSGTRDRVLRELGTLLGEGYRTLKLKVGRQSLAEDVAATRAVRSLAGARATLRLDANRAWSLEEAIRFGREVAAEDIAYLEEPLADPSGLPAFFEATRIPVALDESVCDLDPEDLEGRSDVRAVVLKPTLLGGLSRARHWAEKAIALGMMPVASASFESGVGILALARFASSLGCPEVAVGLDTYRWLARDVITPGLRFSGGRLEPAPAEGRTYEIDAAPLQEIHYA